MEGNRKGKKRTRLTVDLTPAGRWVATDNCIVPRLAVLAGSWLARNDRV